MKRDLRYRWKDCQHTLAERTLENLGLAFEIDFYEGVLDKDPTHVEALIALGELYTQAGRLHEGLAVDRKLIKLFPYDPTVHYNLACSLALLSLDDEAIDTLRKAVNLGYEDFEHLQNDGDLDNIRSHPKFIELLLNARK